MLSIKKIWNEYKYGALIFCILLLFLYVKYDEHIDEDVLCSYVISYQTGFGGRKLIASIINLFFGVVTLGKIRILIYILSTLICAVFSLLCNEFLKKAERNGQERFSCSAFIVAFYLLCPASIMYLLQYPNLGRPDAYLYTLCLLLCPLFYYRKKSRLLYFISLTFLMMVAILTHHVFVASFMSFFVALFIYDIWEKGFDVTLFWKYGIVAIITGGTLLLVMTKTIMNIDLDEAIHFNPNITLSRKMVCYGYYAHITDHMQYYVTPKLPRLAAGFCLSNLFLSPLLFALWHIWHQLYLSLTQTRTKKLLLGILGSSLLLIPAFCITIDYPRWFSAFFFMQFLLIAYFIFDDKSVYHNIGNLVSSNLKKYSFFALFLLVYCSLLGYFQSDNYFDIVEIIIEKLNIDRPTTLLPIEYRI